MSAPVLTPAEIAAYLLDVARIDRATAVTLEQRIIAYANSRAEQAREEATLKAFNEALDKAELAVRRTKGERQKAGAQRVLSAVRSLLPSEVTARHHLEAAKKQEYHRGFRDGKRSINNERNG